jgi:Tol biopolymer transport system component
MKRLALLLASTLLVNTTFVFQGKAQDGWPELEGSYLGQEPPGDTPEIFAPDLISTKDNFELNSVFSPRGNIFMFSRRIDGAYKMFFSFKGANGQWSEPRLAGPSKTYQGHADVDMVFSQDQKWLYFISDRPLEGYSLDRYNIWRSRIGEYGLETPTSLPAFINGPDHELYPMIVQDGSLYFSAQREDSLGGRDSYRSQYRDGKFEEPVNLGPSINSPQSEGDIFVSPDESYLIHVSSDRDDGFGRGDLYISFKQPDHTWSKSKNMGALFNSAETDYCPMVTPDGKYFFFSRGGDVMWVSSDALENLRD